MAVIDFNVDPYYDDFAGASGAESKNFHRVLFRPGFPVQARELTQLQSILQNQVERFGKHIFEDGSMVIPGDFNFDLEYDFIKLQSTFNAQNVENYRADFVNKIITGSQTGIKARVIGTVAATSADPLTLYIKYEDSGTDGVTKTFTNGESIKSLNIDNTTIKNPELTANQTTELNATLLPTSAVGTGSACKVNQGVYFINGFFVQTTTQIILLDKYTNRPSYRIGFKIVQSTVTPEEDATLKDNAQGSSNFAAPGAHRYKISLVLEKRTLESTADTNFVELARIDTGVVQKKVKRADYSILQEEFARRTHDESGDYEVKPFKLDVREHLNSGSNRGIFTAADGGSVNKLALGIEPGKAYVQGYEVETQAVQFLSVDKPRTFARVVDTPIQTPVGNYILIDTVTGTPALDQFEEVYIYDDLLSGSPTVVGTANVRSFILHSGQYTGTASDVQFKLGLFDIVMNDGKEFSRDARSFGNNATAASASFTANIVPTLISIAGTATSTTGATGVTGQGSLFNSQLRAGDLIYLNETLVGEVSSITNNLSLTLTANGASAVTAGSLSRFSAELIRPDRKILVFPTNYFRMRKIRGDSTSNPDNESSTTYTVRRQFSAETIANGRASFELSTDGETFGSDESLKNYTLFVSTGGFSGALDGDLVQISTSQISLSEDQKTVTFVGLNANDTENSTMSTPVADDNTVVLVTSVSLSGDAASEKTKILRTNGTKVINTQPEAQNTEITLGKADGYRLKGVYMSADFSTAATTSSTNITNRYIFDNGQRDAFYDLARIKLIPGNPSPTGRLLIEFDYFDHTAGDYFSVDSYNTVNYEDIPVYSSSGNDGASYDLRDCLDFRPRVADSGANFTGTGSSKGDLLEIGTNVNADFSYYLGRVDKVFINFDGQMKVASGVPAVSPKPPQNPERGMVIFEIEYAPYVINPQEVKAKKLNNRRYTMRDIGRLEQRISTLETVTSLNLLEKATADLLVKDTQGNDRLKTGFIVDPFTGHGIGNPGSADYRIAVDFKRRICRPMASTDVVSMVETVSTDAERTTAGYKKHRDGVITLPYTEVSLIDNPYASDSADVNPYKVAPYTGEVILTPYSDDWHDTTRRPDLVVVDDNNYDAIKFLADEIGVEGTVWNGWQDVWFGEQVFTGQRTVGSTQQSGWNGNLVQQTGTQQVGQVNVGLQTTLQNSTVDRALGDRIVNLSMIPYIRPRPLHIFASNMKPRTRVYPFFDNVNVQSYIKPDDVFTITSDDRTDFEFNNFPDVGEQANSDPARSHNGDQVAAFAFGDVIKNQEHTATSVTNVDKTGNVVTVTLASMIGISVGHHIRFTNITGSTELNYTAERENTYVVESITGSNITIINIDGSVISTVTAYVSGGSAQRLQASAVVSLQKPDNQETLTGLPLDIYVTNVKNGFAVTDICTGTLSNANGIINQCTISGINGTTSTTTRPTMKVIGDNLVTDDNGILNGVFYIPNTEELKFRTGDRVLRLIDNINNNPEIGLHTTKAERIYRATGIAEEREETILSLRQAEFVRDRVQDGRTVTRSITGSTRFQRTSRVQASGGGNSGGGGGGHDPLAQTFVISNVSDGALITKVDLYFAAKGTRPVIVQLLNTKDGFPGQKIMAQKVLPIEDINISDDASVATTFTFDSPVFVQQDTTYALVVKVDEPGCKLFFSELGATNLGDGRFISVNPLTGTMFLSQNGSTWTPQQTRDFKFTIYRANFGGQTVGTVELKNINLGYEDLQTDPFEVNTGTPKIRVYHRNHGFVNGDSVTITGVADGFYGASSTSVGIPASELNGSHIVSNVTLDTYVITVTESNIEDGGAYPGSESDVLVNDFVGGTNIRATKQLIADIMQPSITQIVLPDTDITYDLSVTKGGDRNNTFTGFVSVQANDNYYPDNTLAIKSVDNQSTNGYSATLKATLVTESIFVSPMIDGQRISLACVSNRVDDLSESDVNIAEFDNRTVVTAQSTIALSNTNSTITTSNADRKLELLTLDIGKTITVSGASNSNNNKDYVVTGVSTDGATVTVTPAPGTDESAGSTVTIVQKEKYISDIAPSGATNTANYVTRRFTLENPSTAIRIMYEMNRPNGTEMDVYYKILKDGDEAPFDSIPYILSDIDTSDSPDEESNIFRERTHTVSDLDSFSSIAIKMVFKSSNTVKVPQIKNLRVIALAV